MARLMGSSEPGEIERFEAMRLLRQRLVLTEAICHALDATDGLDPDLLAEAALTILRSWMRANVPQTEWSVEPYPQDGVRAMVVPPAGEHLMERLVAATPLAEAFWMIQTADSWNDYRSDQAHILEELEKWRGRRDRTPAPTTT